MNEEETVAIKVDDLIAVRNVHYALEALIALLLEPAVGTYSNVGCILTPIEERLAAAIRDFPE